MFGLLREERSLAAEVLAARGLRIEAVREAIVELLNYVLGVDPGFGFPMLRPERSAPGEANDPALVPIDITTIEYVYVRKQAHGTQDDDAWRLDSVFVLLYDDASVPLTGSRLFTLLPPEGMWFGNEHGHQAWLTEARRPGAGVRTFLDRLGPKVHSAKKRSVQSKKSSRTKR